MIKLILPKLAFFIILMIAQSPASEVLQSEWGVSPINYKDSVEGGLSAQFETTQTVNTDDRIRAIWLCFLGHDLHCQMDFCELDLILNSNTPLPDIIKALATEALSNVTEEEIRLGLGLIQIKVMMEITPCEVEEPPCVPKPLSKSRNRFRRKSAIF